MYTLVIIFYVALAGILVLVLLKHREVKTGHPSLVSRFGRGSDRFFSFIFSGIKRTISYINKHTLIAIAQWLAFHVLVHVRNVYVELKHGALGNPHSKKVIDMVRGKGEVKKHGASFYLRRISSDDK